MPDAMKDLLSTAGGVAKTFVKGTAGSNSEKDVDYGEGPSPEVKSAKPPDNWYQAYGKSADKSKPAKKKTLGKR